MDTHYLCILEFEYVCNNKLKKEVLDYFRSIDRTLIEKEKIEELKATILENFQKINEANKRCKPLKLSFETTDKDNWEIKTGDFIVRDLYILKFSIRKCKLKQISSLPYYSPTLN